MSQQRYKGPKLPRNLLDQFGSGPSRNQSSRSDRKFKSSGRVSRKDQRRIERQEKKIHHPRPARTFQRREVDEEESDGASEEVFDASEVADRQPTKSHAVKGSPRPSEKPPKSILKMSKSGSPEPPRISRTVKARLAEDDAQIAALEKKLGKRRKMKTSADDEDDVLSGLLDDFDEVSDLEESRGLKRKRKEYEDFLSSKRRAVSRGDSESDSENLLQDLEDMESDDIAESDDAGNPEDEDFGGLSDDLEEEQQKPKQRENPYVAPVSNGAKAEKYVPPSLREASGSDAESLTRIRRQIQGSLNRLSEANLNSILRDIERLYQSNARQFVTSTMIDLLIGLLADRTRLNDTFLVLHAGFIAALYKVIGIEFGAQMVERIVKELDKSSEENEDSQQGSKAASNLISLLAMLYVFQVIASNIVFDYVRIFLQELSEFNTELLLIIVKSKSPGTVSRHEANGCQLADINCDKMTRRPSKISWFCCKIQRRKLEKRIYQFGRNS